MLLILLLGQVMTGQETAHSKINVSGEGVVHAIPDQVHLYFAVRNEGQDPKTVKQENDQLTAKLIDLLMANGVDAKDIKTERLSLQKQFNHRVETEEKYTASQSFSLLIRDPKAYADINALLLSAGVNQIDRVVFSSTRYNELKDEARRRAVEDALSKVDLYSKALGVVQGDLIEISEMDAGAAAPVYREVMANQNTAGPAKIAPGSLVVSQKVTLTYSLK